MSQLDRNTHSHFTKLTEDEAIIKLRRRLPWKVVLVKMTVCKEFAFVICSGGKSAATAKRKAAPARKAAPRKPRKGKKALEVEAAEAEALSLTDNGSDGLASEAPGTDIPGTGLLQTSLPFAYCNRKLPCSLTQHLFIERCRFAHGTRQSRL